MTELDLAELQAMIPLARTLGIELVQTGPELVVARMEWAQERCTAGGVLHGGALMSLADTAGAVCAVLNLPEGAASTATIESKTNLMRAVRGGTVTVQSRPLHRGGTLSVIESTVSDDAGIVAKTIQTQIYHYPRGN